MKNDRGSVSVVIAAFIVLVVVSIQAFLTLAIFLHERSTTHNAADASALAGAHALSMFDGDPCEKAREIASKNGVKLISCQVVENTVDVEVKSISSFGIVAKSRSEVGV